MYAALFHWRLLIFIGKNWRWLLEVNTKHIFLESYSMKIRIYSINQILRNKEKVKYICNVNTLTRIIDRNIPGVYQFLSNNRNSRTRSVYLSMSHWKYKMFFGSLCNTKSKWSAHNPPSEGSGRNMEMFFSRRS